MSENLAAFIMPVSFAILILIIRKYPNVDMVPLQLYAGITAMTIGYTGWKQTYPLVNIFRF